MKFGSEIAHNNRINSDSPPQRSFVPNGTSLPPLRPAGYAERYAPKTYPLFSAVIVALLTIRSYTATMFEHCLYFNTTALARQLEKEWADAFAPFELTPPQAFMLRTVLEKPGLLQREIAESMAISRPTATRALDGLAAKGFIQRIGSEHDGREQTVQPTPSAVEIHAALNEASRVVTTRLKKVLGQEVFTDTVAKVRGVRAALK